MKNGARSRSRATRLTEITQRTAQVRRVGASLDSTAKNRGRRLASCSSGCSRRRPQDSNERGCTCTANPRRSSRSLTLGAAAAPVALCRGDECRGGRTRPRGRLGARRLRRRRRGRRRRRRLRCGRGAPPRTGGGRAACSGGASIDAARRRRAARRPDADAARPPAGVCVRAVDGGGGGGRPRPDDVRPTAQRVPARRRAATVRGRGRSTSPQRGRRRRRRRSRHGANRRHHRHRHRHPRATPTPAAVAARVQPTLRLSAVREQVHIERIRQRPARRRNSPDLRRRWPRRRRRRRRLRGGAAGESVCMAAGSARSDWRSPSRAAPRLRRAPHPAGTRLHATERLTDDGVW